MCTFGCFVNGDERYRFGCFNASDGLVPGESSGRKQDGGLSSGDWPVTYSCFLRSALDDISTSADGCTHKLPVVIPVDAKTNKGKKTIRAIKTTFYLNLHSDVKSIERLIYLH